jgi:hypothetical protein
MMSLYMQQQERGSRLVPVGLLFRGFVRVWGGVRSVSISSRIHAHKSSSAMAAIACCVEAQQSRDAMCPGTCP